MISSLSNKKVRLVQSLQARSRVRYRERRLVVEGTRLVQEGLTAGLAPDLFFYTANWAQSRTGAPLLETAESVTSPLLVSEEVLRSCTDTETPPGVLAVFPFPDLPIPAAPTLVLVVDRLRMPGNLGAILRTAAAARVELALLPPGNVDPLNPKVLRGGMGAHFQLPVSRVGWKELARRLSGLNIWLASAAKGRRYDQIDWRQPTALIVGGEAAGATERVASMASGQVHIPMPGAMESLNSAVATGVLLFEIARQRAEPIPNEP